MKEIFAVIGKRPLAGYSKTRLSEEVGEEVAVKLYRAMMGDFFFRFYQNKLNLDLSIFGSPTGSETEAFFKRIAPSCEYHEQKEAPFFERLAHVFDVHHDKFIHLTGTDIPDFPFEVLKEVKQEEADVFIGPDDDGGFYYLAAKGELNEIFNFKSNKKNVCKALIEHCQSIGLRVKILKAWGDIDTVADLVKCLSRSRPFDIPETYRISKIHGLCPEA